ncbi:PREDICTED: DNA repair protein RAD51 homolog 3-like [Amphimedon queenslandica]|uniref:DNA repair protein RAD51 homolog 3 n=1 Tax=Amphimedon queenslandica TaxID=400682 RepID=A0A1X7UEW6_AMPQE|nr:PREDICTED: DNA repair protein RAD51 homolog 3-like [Amphimedon queenslandica]|eukprot:XP_019854836.1 PREDICTED: DNA repair protein RAD51 homolog 3-like [Amphimedon queenslandica]
MAITPADASSMEMMKGPHSSTLSSPEVPGSSLQVVGSAKNEGCTALELLSIEQDLDHIVTFSAGIDGMLGGGVPVGKITEFCGSPGIGKTQLSIQLAIDATLPEPFGGCGGHSVYIDTEGSFVIDRVVQIATATVRHVHSVAKSSADPELLAVADGYTLEVVLGNIHYYRCHNHIQLIALSNILHQTISNINSKVCLIVVDSIASPFRSSFKDMGLRHRLLSGLAQTFLKLATQFSLAVVFTNQMTTKTQSNGQSQLVPALGESWGHVCTIRVILYWEGKERQAHLYKSPSHPESVVSYQITKDGVRDVTDDDHAGLDSVAKVDWEEIVLQEDESLDKISAVEGRPPSKRHCPLEC